MSRATLYCGDARAVLRTLPDESVQCVVTSPPYWGLRDYGVAGQLGLEATPDAYVARLVEVFGEVRRVLQDDGTLWLNLGDSYASAWPAPNTRRDIIDNPMSGGKRGPQRQSKISGSLKEKDLIGMPWRVASALRADGWWLRSDIIWSKPNPMPESVTDRPTKAHEYVFLLAKSEQYYYDADAIAEPGSPNTPWSHRSSGGAKQDALGQNAGGGLGQPARRSDKQAGHGRRYAGFNDRWDATTATGQRDGTRNARTVWEIATQPYPEAHFATFPEELARRCVVAGSRPGDTVLDPFGGSGTVAQVATGNGRNAIYVDLNPEYLELARQRIGPMLCDAVVAQ
jgi:DNA modification methylase